MRACILCESKQTRAKRSHTRAQDAREAKTSARHNHQHPTGMGKRGKDSKAEGSRAGKAREAAPSATFDAELDALFNPTGNAPKARQAAAKGSLAKRAGAPAASNASQEAEGRDGSDESNVEESDRDGGADDGEDGELSSIESDAVISGISDDDDDEDEDDVTEAPQHAGTSSEGSEGEAEDDDEDEKDDGTRPVHETVANPSLLKSVPQKTKRKSNREEPSAQRDARSLFVGNLPVHLASSKGSMKAFKRHLVACSPYPTITQIDSIRLRSIPFSKPTDDYEAHNPNEAEDGKKKRQRSRSFKEGLNEAGPQKRVFLSGSQKRKVAYINQEINDKADSLNVYVTLSDIAAKRVEELLEKGKDVGRLTAPALAALLAASVNGSLFEERHLRADLVVPLAPAEIVETGLSTVKTADGSLLGASAGATSIDSESRKRTVFVGNLDFEAKEEELRGFFESLVTRERGSPPDVRALDFTHSDKLPAPEDGEAEGEQGGGVKRLASWVYGVRIIRDAATQMGKGFGYVRFLDAASVDEIMAIHESEQNILAASKSGKPITGDFRRKLKFKGRPLRVSRCKVAKGNVTAVGASSSTDTPKRPTLSLPPRSRSSGAPTPGGSSPFFRKQHQQHQQNVESPTRKSKVAEGAVPNPKPLHADPLKTARNAQKRGDPERQAKRLEKKNKKKADRMKLADGGDKSKVKLKFGKAKVRGKVRRNGQA